MAAGDRQLGPGFRVDEAHRGNQRGEVFVRHAIADRQQALALPRRLAIVGSGIGGPGQGDDVNARGVDAQVVHDVGARCRAQRQHPGRPSRSDPDQLAKDRCVGSRNPFRMPERQQVVHVQHDRYGRAGRAEVRGRMDQVRPLLSRGSRHGEELPPRPSRAVLAADPTVEEAPGEPWRTRCGEFAGRESDELELRIRPDLSIELPGIGLHAALRPGEEEQVHQDSGAAHAALHRRATS